MWRWPMPGWLRALALLAILVCFVHCFLGWLYRPLRTEGKNRNDLPLWYQMPCWKDCEGKRAPCWKDWERKRASC